MSEEREARGGSPRGKYIFHPSLMLASFGASRPLVATGHSAAPEVAGGVVDAKVQSLEMTLGNQYNMFK